MHVPQTLKGLGGVLGDLEGNYQRLGVFVAWNCMVARAVITAIPTTNAPAPFFRFNATGQKSLAP